MNYSEMKENFLRDHFARQREIDSQSRATAAKLAGAHVDLILQGGVQKLKPKDAKALNESPQLTDVLTSIREVPDASP